MNKEILDFFIKNNYYISVENDFLLNEKLPLESKKIKFVLGANFLTDKFSHCYYENTNNKERYYWEGFLKSENQMLGIIRGLKAFL